MKLKRLMITLLITVMVSMIWITNVEAANSFNTSLTANKTTVGRGEEVNVTMRISNISAGQYGITAIQGALEYDTDVIEPIVPDGLGRAPNNLSSNWTSSPVINSSGVFAFEGNPTLEDTDILTVKFAIKENAAYGTTTIRIKDILGSNGLEGINSDPASINITIAENTGNNNTNTNNTNTNTNINNTNTNTNNTNTNNNTYNNVQNVNNNNTNTITNTIPKAGLSEFAFPVATIIVVIAIGSYYKYRRM